MTEAEGSGSVAGGILRGCGMLALVAGILAIAGVVLLYIQLQSSFRGPEAVSVAAAWQRADLHVPAEGRSATGRLTLTSAGGLEPQSHVAVTVGLPTADVVAVPSSPSPAPAAVLRVPSVRLSVAWSGTTLICLAPCEIDLGNALGACPDGACRLDLELQLESLAVAGAPATGPQVVSLAGGVTAGLRERLPNGLAVDLIVDGAAPSPQASP